MLLRLFISKKLFCSFILLHNSGSIKKYHYLRKWKISILAKNRKDNIHTYCNIVIK